MGLNSRGGAGRPFLPALLLLLLATDVAYATDYGTVSSLDISLSAGEKTTRAVEVSRCQTDGCTDTLRLSLTGGSGLTLSVSPQVVEVQKARAGQTFFTDLTVEAPSAASGRYDASLRVSSTTGDSWSYRLDITVRSSAAAVPAAATSRATGQGGAPSGGQGGPPLLPIALGGVAVAVVVFLVLRRRRSPAGPTSRPPYSMETPSGPPRPWSSPRAGMELPRSLVSRMVALLPRRGGGTWTRGAHTDAEVDQEWQRLVQEQVPDAASAAQAEELPFPESGEASEPLEAAAPASEEAESAPVPEEVAAPPEESGVAEPPGEVSAAPEPPAAPDLSGPDEMQALRSEIAGLQTMMGRAMDDLRSLREEMAKSPGRIPALAPPGIAKAAPLSPEQLKELQAEMEQRLRASLEAQMNASVEKLGTWLREALKAVTLMKAQGTQAAASPGGPGALQPLFDGLWKEAGQIRAALQKLEADTRNSFQEVARQRVPAEGLAKEVSYVQSALERMEGEIAALRRKLEALEVEAPGRAGPGAGMAIQADLEALRTILRDNQRQMEGVEARLKNQELTFARGDEVRNLFRDVSGLKEDLGQVRAVLEESARAPSLRLEATSRGTRTEEPPRSVGLPRQEGPGAEEVRKELEKAEAFLRSLEEYHNSGLMPERLYQEKKGQSEERLKEIRRRLAGF